ncbi:acyl-CoA thioesterase FadM [Bacillus fengqiuensis]|nr:acyl-CoA thioesterase FadM [Bacillus fengqiuensis]
MIRAKGEKWCTKVGNTSFTISHEIVDDQTEALIARGEAVIVYFNFDTQKSEPIPETIKQFLQGYMTAV